MPLALNADHLQQLTQGSGIAPGIIAERGAYTATTQKHLADLGFQDYQRRVPALVLPVHDIHGKVALHQIRPDKPRTGKKKRVIKRLV